ncbi:MAG: sigma-70 family RNA polymerase sigma factor [Oscillospiraceae bacterium]|nr:sigma-70 family RNA polymerase sigma factor [Oscillospiraceae bacterium]
MTNEELAVKIQQGDEGLLPELWMQCEQYIKWKARHYIRKYDGELLGCDFEDLVQSGYFAMLNAIKSFAPEMGFKFTTHLKFPLKTSFAEVLGIRTAKRDWLDYATSLDMPIGEDGDATLYDFVSANMSGADNIEEQIVSSVYTSQLHGVLEKCLAYLPDVQQNILRQRYYYECSLEQIAKSKELSRERIRQIESQALQKMFDMRKETGLDEFVERHTDYFLHVGTRQFNVDWESAVEKIVLKRERLAEKYLKKIRKVGKQYDGQSS